MTTTTTNQQPFLAKGQIWQDTDGQRARVLRVGFQVGNGKRRSCCSMTEAQYVLYFNLSTRRQSTARDATFLDRFKTFVGEG